ncbi:hypothetical protein EIP91_010957 [Steccherinum ochraceum]|uniref:Uncharacterized protein n=1 Tax=Steccherinum ochraceum TaxID=92696 RepID=A0A4V2MUV1_9APHY|nr:hypothetical protein EIP91_010957 [Steccherinum ochraceum]
MSAEATAEVLASSANGTTPAPWLTFPPFPAPPPGVRLIPFSEFKPKGLVVRVEDPEDNDVEESEEVDAEGIPTVALRVKHELTEAEQARKKKRKTKSSVPTTTMGADGVVRRTMWWEEWEDGEKFRGMSPLNPNISTLLMSSSQFRLYVGIISSILPPPSKRRSAAQAAPDEDDLDEDVDMMDAKEVVVVDPEVANAKRRADEEAAIKHRRDNLSEEAKERIVKRHEIKDARMEFFLNDPEQSMTIFFIKLARRDKVRCRDGPILVQFFIEFLLRNRVLPESEKEFKKALEIVKLARRELLQTYVISGALPDIFSDRLCTLFGSMTQRAVWRPADKEELERFAEQRKKMDEEQKQRKLEADERDKKRFAEFVASNAAGTNIKAVDPDVDLSDAEEKDITADNVDQNGVEVQPNSGWGDTPTWDDAPPVWGGAGANTGSGAGGSSSWAEPDASNDWETVDNAVWGLQTKFGYEESLLEVLGPTVLPHTHTTGIIEQSTRKIVEVVLPPTSSQGKKVKTKKGRTAAEAVEHDLEQRFGYMVLAPWKKIGNHDASDIQTPDIRPDSRGTVIDPKAPASTINNGVATSNGTHAFDPKKDLIHVLITAEAAEKAIESMGMGLLATWIQLARRDHAAEPEDEDIKGWEKINSLDPDRKYGATGVNGAPTKWWYMEQLTGAFPSFHADRHYDNQ